MNSIIAELTNLGNGSAAAGDSLAAKICADTIRVIEQFQRGYNATGLEGEPCPGCEYEEGVFIKLCGLHQQLADLQAIVAKLPKCWRLVDGVLVKDCPVVLGVTRVYYVLHSWSEKHRIVSGIVFAATIGIECNGPPYLTIALDGEDGRTIGDTQSPATQLYDTKEAAEAAREKV